MAIDDKKMACVTIDDQEYQVEVGQNLLQACLSLGLDLPYFCWHPALGSVGACRQCALIQYQDENDSRGRLVMGCMTPVTDGQILSIEADNAVNFRAAIIETLMTNHPHDCPVCEEGGECHLQDMTVMSGHNSRRYRGLKRTFTNQQLGPFINHEMNRCITCYRCLRYYRDYAGGTDLHALSSRNKTYFGRFEDGTLESGFAGNLVEVCPTGVFTDKTFSEHYSRKWDLQCAPSVCVHCSLGCNTSPGERYGKLKRIQNRYHHEINGYFLCDRGRFGYGHVNHPRRPLHAVRQHNDETVALSTEEASSQLKRLLDNQEVHWIGIGSPRATLEANRALQTLVGEDHFYSGLNEHDNQLNHQLHSLMGSAFIQIPSLREIEQADTILVLGEDISHSAPRMALSIRQAIRAKGKTQAATLGIPPWQEQAVQIAGQGALHPLFISHCGSTQLDTLATETFRGSTVDQARLGFAVAQALSADAPRVDALDDVSSTLAQQIASALQQARQPLIVCGTSAASIELIEAAGQIIRALVQGRSDQSSRPWLAPVFNECNSLGSYLLNQHNSESNLENAFALAARGQVGAIILENDLYLRTGSAQADQFFNDLAHCVAVDCLFSPTAAKAELLLPATSFAENQGTLINNEARAQAIYPVHPPQNEVRPAWQWLCDCLQPSLSAIELLQSCGAEFEALQGLDQLFPAPGDRFAGMKIARMTHRASGRTAMRAQVSVHEPKQPEDAQSAMAFTMEGIPAGAMQTELAQSSELQLPYSWFPGWNSNQSIHKFQQEVNGAMRGGDSGIRLTWRTQTSDWATPPVSPQPDPQQLFATPQPRLFGGEELSMLSAPVVERAGRPRLRLHPEDAEVLAIAPGDRIELQGEQEKLMLPVQLDEQVSRGVVLVPQPYATLRGLVSVRSLGPEPVIASDREADHG